MKPIYKWLAAASGVLFVAFLFWYFHTIVFYILAAAVVSIIGKPMVDFMKRIKIGSRTFPSWLAALLALLAILLVFFGLCAFLFPILFNKLKFLAGFDMAQISQLLSKPIGIIDGFAEKMLPGVEFSTRDYMMGRLEPLLNAQTLSNVLNSVSSTLVNLLMAVFCVGFISFFFMKEEGLFHNGLLLVFPSKYEANVERAMKSITHLLGRYFRGICMENAIGFTMVSIGGFLFGLDWETAVIIGLFVALFNVIPYVGPMIGLGIGMFIASVTPVEGVTIVGMMMRIAGVILTFNLIDNLMLQPLIYSNSVKAHPLEIFVVILMAGYIAGVVGMLFAIPTYTVLRVMAKEFFNNLKVVQKLTEKI